MESRAQWACCGTHKQWPSSLGRCMHSALSSSKWSAHHPNQPWLRGRPGGWTAECWTIKRDLLERWCGARSHGPPVTGMGPLSQACAQTGALSFKSHLQRRDSWQLMRARARPCCACTALTQVVVTRRARSKRGSNNRVSGESVCSDSSHNYQVRRLLPRGRDPRCAC